MIAMGLKNFITPLSLSWQVYQYIKDRGVVLKLLLIQDWNDFLTGFQHTIFGAPRNSISEMINNCLSKFRTLQLGYRRLHQPRQIVSNFTVRNCRSQTLLNQISSFLPSHVF